MGVGKNNKRESEVEITLPPNSERMRGWPYISVASILKMPLKTSVRGRGTTPGTFTTPKFEGPYAHQARQI